MSTGYGHIDKHNRVAINQFGIWLFFLGESFLFGALISVRYYLQGTHQPDHLNQLLGLAITGILLLSSFTAYLAECSAASGDWVRLRRYLVGTILLGSLFLVGVGIEWYEAFLHFPPSTGFGTVFFTTTGIHAFHVLSGLIALSVITFLCRCKQRFNEENHWGVEGTIKYWHFVDVAWFFIYPTLYLVS
jgi:cytochrome c oxidase subunit 3|tara:strand:- start:33 stop:599 length:567 start_codon:yes stop_codon:yes gene_type:complete